MVFTKAELIASLQHEVHILLHLASKVDERSLDYRPTARQRSAIELLRYLSMMGPALVGAALTGTFDGEKWGAEAKVAATRDLAQTCEVIAAQAGQFQAMLGDLPDETFRKELDMFGRKTTIGSFLVNSVLSGYAAYRTQLFCYLKACGREELNTMNLWAGIDPPQPK